MVQYLVRQGASVNGSWYNETPLHKATVNGHQEVAEFLVLKGAHVGRKSLRPFCQTPLQLAFEYNHDDLLFYLLETWFAKHSHDDRCETAVYEALSLDDDETFKFFLDNYLVDDKKYAFEQKPLHHAIEHGSINLIKLLLANNFDRNKKNKRGLLPVEVAVLSRSLEIAKLLLDGDRVKLEKIKNSFCLGCKTRHTNPQVFQMTKCKHTCCISCANKRKQVIQNPQDTEYVDEITLIMQRHFGHPAAGRVVTTCPVCARSGAQLPLQTFFLTHLPKTDDDGDEEMEGKELCPICREELPEDRAFLTCTHAMCHPCLANCRKHNITTCPTCRQNFE